MAEPDTFGRYRVTKSLGSGAMGDVDGERDRLDEYEDRVGESPASRDLRHQLDHLRKPPKHHGPKHGPGD